MSAFAQWQFRKLSLLIKSLVPIIDQYYRCDKMESRLDKPVEIWILLPLWLDQPSICCSDGTVFSEMPLKLI